MEAAPSFLARVAVVAVADRYTATWGFLTLPPHPFLFTCARIIILALVVRLTFVLDVSDLIRLRRLCVRHLPALHED